MLTSKQRAILRGKANTMDPVFIVGKGEIDETMIQVVDECQHRIGEGVQNAGQHQDDANGCSGDAVADAGRITCHTDQGVDAHAHKGVAGVADDLP